MSSCNVATKTPVVAVTLLDCHAANNCHKALQHRQRATGKKGQSTGQSTVARRGGGERGKGEIVPVCNG